MWKNFTDNDLRCQETGEWNDHPAFIPFMDMVQELRTEMGFPFYVTSGYRSPKHSIEARKSKPGSHSRAAIDFRVTTAQSWLVVERAMQMGFKGIGIKKSNVAGCCIIHLDADPERTVRRMWGY
ncbi:D-Ala-D-Ala carboxypeptidase family metallohydrolase [Vibrio phage vB_VpaM_VPs20]|uniref:D-Ala-D-Ala carboxypeptidase family metallohydrolase n=1 Tax=Vibrio phage vB_VpaM_VPs20 TaxID=2978980 RepID=A0A9X9NZT3_9CAUD|nr:D-Ala-D-Ala carboxypeptidase family metallohydrolase [Vibrio phage vB_VpaM_VPs20]UYD72138.1 D-Ala-D-Ala carboxypeptidase family metallohydrolase [Vibrio phage vB_VpaM_VPs20]WJJ50383.1 D-Ala-D-Ala carboxypeptidase family metallohydrolase [synthetic construct]